MAKIRKAVAYRRLERPYTRKSKYRQKNYVRASPHNSIVKYIMGNVQKEFPVTLELVSDVDIQLRHNCIESARKSAIKLLEERLGKNFRLQIRMFPHHVLRENPLATGAGADRMSTGMTQSFGKPIGIAAQVRKGKVIMDLAIEAKDIPTGTLALKRSQYKFPMRCMIRVKDVTKDAAKRAPAKAAVAPVKKAPAKKKAVAVVEE